MEEIPFPSMSFEQLFPSLARSQSSQDTYTADLSPGLADADPGKTFPSLPDKHNEVEADHNEDERDASQLEPTSFRNTAAMEMETDEAKSIEKTTSPEAESAEGSPYSVDLRVIKWMQKSKFIVHTPTMPCPCMEPCWRNKLSSLIDAMLQSLMHKGFLRQLSDEHAGFVNWWLIQQRLLSRSAAT